MVRHIEEANIPFFFLCSTVELIRWVFCVCVCVWVLRSVVHRPIWRGIEANSLSVFILIVWKFSSVFEFLCMIYWVIVVCAPVIPITQALLNVGKSERNKRLPALHVVYICSRLLLFFLFRCFSLPLPFTWILIDSHKLLTPHWIFILFFRLLLFIALAEHTPFMWKKSEKNRGNKLHVISFQVVIIPH